MKIYFYIQTLFSGKVPEIPAFTFNIFKAITK